MNWVFDYEGEWTASSAEEGLQYRIQVCDDGSFDISKSDHGLTNRKETFQRLRNAKLFCETEEQALADTLLEQDEMCECGEIRRYCECR